MLRLPLHPTQVLTSVLTLTTVHHHKISGLPHSRARFKVCMCVAYAFINLSLFILILILNHHRVCVYLMLQQTFSSITMKYFASLLALLSTTAGKAGASSNDAPVSINVLPIPLYQHVSYIMQNSTILCIASPSKLYIHRFTSFDLQPTKNIIFVLVDDLGSGDVDYCPEDVDFDLCPFRTTWKGSPLAKAS